MKTIRLPSLVVLGAVLFLIAFLAIVMQRPQEAQGSVAEGSSYVSTTTGSVSAPSVRQLKAGYGALGQVTITLANTGTATLYNATTSDVTKRTNNTATTSILIADFPTNAAAGTYTFDATFTDGLLLVTAGTPATSTITYR